ncbi:ABC-three component system protein [Yersinia enterocolitica]|uniref:ABC-three component system protein n=1 Tax=Yersinia enterocolitica TaxID=630 RepID=UPI001C6094F6|nr:ABC-three component system protein [Yersinia enterocolitica]EKN5949061.1 hypothetical protein [Yersinia enterocolitica]MBW5818996.1 hypothetical protein [Yersinia enterocolitica]MBW5875357.1 hypothetical protein [Yersinia enterocolitica]HEN3254105.1 hypothetical protein [Yersinia enterocolitica]
MTNNLFEKLLGYAVIIDNGSGAIFQPMSHEYSYILTAKHNVIVDPEDLDSDLKTFSDIKINTTDGSSFRVNNIFLHSDSGVDAALILTDKVDIDFINRYSFSLYDRMPISIIGFPGVRSEFEEINDRHRKFDGCLSSYINNSLIVEVTGFPDYEQIAGVSGGGVYRIIDGKFYLIGIQIGFDGNPEVERHGRLKCLHLNVFDEILNLRTDSYSPILPPHLLSFKYLINNIFPLEGASSENNISFVRVYLKNLASSISIESNITPFDIFKLFGSKLLIANSSETDAHEVKLWVSFLEMMVIGKLIDNDCDLNVISLEKIMRKRRLLFSSTEENWLRCLYDIFSSDLSGLQKGGTIIISTNTAHVRTSVKGDALDSVITDIGRADQGLFNIDDGIDLKTDYKLVHIDGISQDCITMKDEEYSQYNRFSHAGLEDKLKDGYSAFIS